MKINLKRKNGLFALYFPVGMVGLFLLLVQAVFAQPIFFENFENLKTNQFRTVNIVSENPGEGAYSAHLAYSEKQTSDVVEAIAPKVIEVQPDTWYKMKVRQKNDIKNGESKFGLIESRSATERKVVWYARHWKAIPLNITEWKDYEMEFKTAANTHGIQLYLRTENKGVGSSWWDHISIEKFDKKIDPIEIKPFYAAATFTDIPTECAYMVVKGDLLNETDRRRRTTYHWRTLDLKNEKMMLVYKDVLKDSTIVAKLIRGKTIYFTDTRKVEGSGTLDYSLKLQTLPEGIYLFQAVLMVNGKPLCTKEKEIWRIESRKSVTPKHEAIIKSGTGPHRQRQINGKNYSSIAASMAPTWGLLSHHRDYCKPDVDTYIDTMQKQFGQDVFGVWYWRGPQWDNKDDEFVKSAIVAYREHLDFLAKHNCYGRAGIVLSTYKKMPVNYDEIRKLVRGVKSHPALLSWTLDEPEVKKYSPEMMLKIYKMIKEEDPNHIIDVNLCSSRSFQDYASCSDIASFDVYPFPGTSLLENEKRTMVLLKAFPTAPFDSYLQMFNFNTLAMPTFNQVRATFILDRINGSHCLLAYSWGESRKSFLTDLELQGYYRAIVSMFRRLEPVLSDGKEQKVDAHFSTNYVKACSFSYQGETIILLVNISPDTKATVDLKWNADQAENFFDSAWKYQSKKGLFSFHLKPVETLVLRVK